MIPAFNGGALLEQTLRSCVKAEFDPDQILVVVCDNGSTDGSYEKAIATAAAPACAIQVFRNSENLGRVGNWNRCLEIARGLGAKFGTFLMVGDEWLSGADPLEIVEYMDAVGASLGLAPYHLVDAEGKLKRVGRNFIRGERRGIPAQPFINQALSEGALCFGPLQANIYRLDGVRPLAFDPEDPTHTDQRATLVHLGLDAETILLWDRPYFAWKAHPGRFHMAMDVRKRAQEDIELIQSIADQRGLSLDPRRINTNLFLLAVREWVGKPNGFFQIREAAKAFSSSPGGLSWLFAGKQVFQRVVLRRYLT